MRMYYDLKSKRRTFITIFVKVKEDSQTIYKASLKFIYYLLILDEIII